jgi:hypothetical protein
MSDVPSRNDGRGAPAASDHARLASELEAGAVQAERMAVEWEADGRPTFAARRRALAGRLRERAAAHRRAADGISGTRH